MNCDNLTKYLIVADFECVGIVAKHCDLSKLCLAAEEAKQFDQAVLREALEIVMHLLFPMTPHFCEELWEETGHGHYLASVPWPHYNAEAAKEEELIIVVQVNGKLRTKLQVAAGIENKTLEELALADEKIAPFLKGAKPKKIIVVPNKLVNIVL